MLRATQLSGFGVVASGRPSYEYQNTYTATTGTSYTSVSFGAASRDRIIVVYLVAWMSSGSITGVTIGGVSATTVVSGGDSTFPTYIFSASVPTGTSGTVSFTGSVVETGISVWSVMGCSATAKSSGGKNTSTTYSVTSPANGIVLLGDYPGASGATWTNVTQSRTVSTQNYTITSADYKSTAAETRTVTNTYNNAGYGLYVVYGA